MTMPWGNFNFNSKQITVHLLRHHVAICLSTTSYCWSVTLLCMGHHSCRQIAGTMTLVRLMTPKYRCPFNHTHYFAINYTLLAINQCNYSRCIITASASIHSSPSKLNNLRLIKYKKFRMCH